MSLDAYAHHLLLDYLGTLVTRVSIHSNDPGADGGTALFGNSFVGVARQVPVWAPASGRELSLAENLVFTGGTPGDTIRWVALWDAGDPPLRYARAQFGSPKNFDGVGVFVLTTAMRFRFVN